MNPRVKICGITNVEDALAAVDAGAHALGFMFFAGSKRHVSLPQARDIIRALPPFIARVGVFVNGTDNEVREAVRVTGVDTLQFHGDETPEFCARFRPLKVYRAFRIKDAASLEQLPAFDAVDAWLLDSFVAGQQGGTGERFNWELAVRAREMGKPVILAGGLNPDNVAEAARRVAPYGLDLSSGVESAPGRKDAVLMNRLFSALRAEA